MALTDVLDDRNRLARIALAAVSGLVAVRALRRGKRATGVLAALGAVALGYSARADIDDLAAEIDIDDAGAGTDADTSDETTTGSEVRLRCAACGEPIVPGQSRGPDEQDRTVHESCLQTVA